MVTPRLHQAPRGTLADVATVVAFHAHPDDEVLLTGGTLARLAAEGHRVVIVVACDGAMWSPNGRLEEFRASAAILGAARSEHLGYADSGHGPVLYDDPPGRTRFARADIGEAARRLADLIREENADLLLSYDAQGGYGHRDHIRVHDVGARAAELTGVRVLEATVPRELAVRGVSVLSRLGLVVRFDMKQARASGTPGSAITHRVNVRRYAGQKQAALAAHRTPLHSTGRSARLFRLAVALPVPLFRLLAGREWFAEPGAAPGPVCDDILRSRGERLARRQVNPPYGRRHPALGSLSWPPGETDTQSAAVDGVTGVDGHVQAREPRSRAGCSRGDNAAGRFVLGRAGRRGRGRTPGGRASRAAGGPDR